MPTTPRWAGLGGRAHGDERAPGAPFVFLHGLTFDSQMWGPVLDALPSGHRAVAFDLPGHGSSAALPRHGHAAVVEAVQEAVLDAGLDAPIPVGGFAEAWAIYQDSWHMELLPDEDRALLGAGDRPGDDALRRLVLSYQSDLLERPLEETVRARDERLSQLRAAGTSYLTLHPCSIDASDRAWLHERLPQAEILVWPVGHHFPHLAHPVNFAALLTGLAVGRAPTTPCKPL